MFHSRNMERRIDKIHERTIKLVYNDILKLRLYELLVNDKSVTLTQKTKKQYFLALISHLILCILCTICHKPN